MAGCICQQPLVYTKRDNDLPFNQLLHRSFRLVRQQRETECDVSPLPLIRSQPIPLTQLLNDRLCLLILPHQQRLPRTQGTEKVIPFQQR